MLTLLSFIVVLGVVIIAHEWGHFIVARRNGVRVEKFSIGLGPRLWSKKIGQTEYVVSAIPLGGFIKMAGENQDEIRNQPDEFSSKTLWQRGKIVMAGPGINILLAFLIMPFVYLFGIQEPVYLSQSAVIGWIEENSAAEKAGLKEGDQIVSIGTNTIGAWKDLSQALLSKNASAIAIKRGDERLTLSLDGPLAGLNPYFRPVVQNVLPGKAGDRAGLQSGDILLSVNGTPVTSFNHFFFLTKNTAGQEIRLGISRQGSSSVVLVTPEYDERLQKVIVGIALGTETVFRKYGLIESIRTGAGNLVDSISMTFAAIGKLITGKMSMDSLGGPIGIAQMSGQAAKAGLGAFLSLMAMISLQLGIFNLLPIPVLDGGWLILFFCEAIRGKTLSKRFIQIAQSTGFGLILGLIVYVSINDILKLLR